MGKTVEFRGCDNLVIAAITGDDTTGYTTGAVEVLYRFLHRLQKFQKLLKAAAKHIITTIQD